MEPFDHLHTSIVTYETVDTRLAIDWLQWWHEFVLRHMGVDKSEVKWLVKVVYLDEKDKNKRPVAYERVKWAKIANENDPLLCLGLLGKIVNRRVDGFPFLCNITSQIWNTPHLLQEFGQPEIANVLSCSIDTKLLSRQIAPELQEEITAFASSTFTKAEAMVGHITYNWYGYAYASSPYETFLGYTYPEVGAHFSNHLRGCYWGNLLRQEHIDLLGGLDAFRELPIALVKDLNDGYYYIQLTKDINQFDEAILRQVHDFFSPLFLSPKLILPGRTLEKYFQQFFNNMWYSRQGQ